MTKIGRLAAGWLAGTTTLLGTPAVLAQPRPEIRPEIPVAAVDVEALLEAASRGDFGPVERALAAPLAPDIFALLRAATAAARYDDEVARDPALARLAAGPDPVLRRGALSVMTSAAFGRQDYAEAAQAGRRLEAELRAAGKTREADETKRSWELAALLAGRPQQTVGTISETSIPASRDVAGLTRIEAQVDGMAQEAVVDTGAGFSVLTADTARRLGVVPIEGGTQVGNSIDTTVPVRVGIAPRVEIAGVVVRNVPFLILDDAALSFALPNGRYEIKAIIGLPLLRALGRVRIEQAGRFAVLAPAPAAGPQNLYANADELHVAVSLGGQPVALQLDTGANRTSLTARYAAEHPEAVARLETGEARSAGAGGARVQQAATWRGVPVTLAGRNLILPAVSIALPTGAPLPRLNGTLGQDALRAFESYTIDLKAMRIDLGAPVAAPAAPAP